MLSRALLKILQVQADPALIRPYPAQAFGKRWQKQGGFAGAPLRQVLLPGFCEPGGF
jgi:hypothetical protein